MQHNTFDGTQTRDGEFDARDRFNVVILYDGAKAGRRAINQLRKVTDPLAEGLDLQVRLWRLDVVMDPAAATTVARDLATADLLLLALDDDGSLNENARERLQEAVYQMRGQGAAVAILTKDDAPTVPSRFDFLQHAAKEAGVGFLFPPASSVPAGTEPAFTAIHDRATLMTPVLEGILKDIHSLPHWEHDA